MAVFVHLKDRATYRPCDLLEDGAVRHRVRGSFERHFASTFVTQALATYGEGKRKEIEAAREAFGRRLKEMCDEAKEAGPADLYMIDVMRQEVLIEHGIPDPFAACKTRENTAMMGLYRRVVDELDSHKDPREQLLLAIEGVFAGNVFDLGAGGTAALFAEKSVDFVSVRNRIQRPWLKDDFDAYADRVLGRGHRKAVFFVDNAGSDCILGVVPFVRMLARRGTRVVLAANDLPALNDVTSSELREILPALGAMDGVLAELLAGGEIAVVSSGACTPLLNLADVSEDLNHAAAGADIVYLEGMGRSLVSNCDARFAVDCVKLCMLKDTHAATKFGGKVFDVILRFEAT